MRAQVENHDGSWEGTDANFLHERERGFRPKNQENSKFSWRYMENLQENTFSWWILMHLHENKKINDGSLMPPKKIYHRHGTSIFW